MRKLLIALEIVTSVAVVGVPLSSYATPQEDINCEAVEKHTHTPAGFHNLARFASNKPEAIKNFKKAELGYLCAGDNENAQKVREQLANVDQINFAENRKKKNDILQGTYRPEGDDNTKTEKTPRP